MALRLDIGTLRPARTMSDGRIMAEAYISRAGIFEYMDERGKIRRELRPVEEVFHPEALASFGLVPVTNNHPTVGNLDATTARKFMVGSTGEQVTRDPDPEGQGRDHVRTSVMVADGATITDMKNGKVETSSGYNCDIEEKSGVHPVWGRYDAIQRNIRGNHVAIVDSARAGRTVRIRMDSAATQIYNPPVLTGDRSMDPEKLQETIRSLGAQLTESKERIDSLEKEKREAVTRADVAEGRLLTVEARNVELQTTLSARADSTETAAVAREKKRADEAEEKVARFDATLEGRVRQRSKLERQAFTVMGNDFRMDDLDDRAIMATVVKRLDSSADVSPAVATGVIQGRFLSLIESYAKNARAQVEVANVMNETREVATRNDNNNRKPSQRDLWKQPLPNSIRTPGKE